MPNYFMHSGSAKLVSSVEDTHNVPCIRWADDIGTRLAKQVESNMARSRYL